MLLIDATKTYTGQKEEVNSRFHHRRSQIFRTQLFHMASLGITPNLHDRINNEPSN